ncbi:hypothetical protein BT69DRAFT_1336597 [Atractiella rhizophila]|nr:hypothetical protein BT69DRAFT_1336597 [Atractiella rhizophila]
MSKNLVKVFKVSENIKKANPLGLWVLCIDNGGIRSFSTPYMLEQITLQASHLLKVPEDEDLRPCDIFDLICGTSTSGWIALMLGRLGMTVRQCIAAYEEIGREATIARTEKGSDAREGPLGVTEQVSNVREGCASPPGLASKGWEEGVSSPKKASKLQGMIRWFRYISPHSLVQTNLPLQSVDRRAPHRSMSLSISGEAQRCKVEKP